MGRLVSRQLYIDTIQAVIDVEYLGGLPFVAKERGGTGDDVRYAAARGTDNSL